MYRVLLADDEVLIREAVKNSIKWNELGYELAACCANGKEACRVMEQEQIDLVITDICMPYMDGMELSKYVYENYPATKVLILSGYDDFQYARQAIRYKVEEYLLKPVTAAELSSYLKTLYEKMDRQQEQTKELEQMKGQMEKNRLALRTNALMHLMEFGLPIEELERELAESHILLDKDYYRVATVVIDLFDNGQPSEETREQSALMSFVVYNGTVKVVEEEKCGEVFQNPLGQTVLLLFTNRPKSFEKTLQDICIRIQEAVREAIHLPVSIGVGNYVRDWKEIPKSYRESQNCLTYRYLLGGGQIIQMDMLEEKDRSLPRLTKNTDALVTQIRINQQAGIRETMEQIGSVMQELMLDKQRVCLTFQQMIQSIRTHLEAMEQLPQSALEEEEKLINSLPGYESFDQLLKALIEYYSKMAVEMELQRNRSMRKPVLMALDYLNKHYDDPDLSLQTICQYLSISTSRFSVLFKEATGETFVEALTNIRIGEAKKLLSQTGMKSYQVAELVGYADPHYFSLCFKKATGMTPTEYAREKRGD